MRDDERPGSGEFDDTMDDYADGGNVSAAMGRLQSANLMSLIKGLEAVECVEIRTTADVTKELQGRISQVLRGIRHHLVQVSPHHGTIYS